MTLRAVTDRPGGGEGAGATIGALANTCGNVNRTSANPHPAGPHPTEAVR